MFNRRIIRFSAKYLLLFELVIRRIKDRLLTVELELLGLSVPRLLICADQEEIKLSVFRWSSVVILQNEPVSVGLRRFVLSSLQNQKDFKTETNRRAAKNCPVIFSQLTVIRCCVT